MRVESSYIWLRGVRFYAYHGVLPQERRVGGEFLVNLRVGYPLDKAILSDDVADTLDYAALYGVVKTEMMQPSRLLEHVAGRIAETILERFPQAQSIELKLTKENPPMGVDCSGAGVEIRCKRDADSDLVNSED